MQVVKAQKLPLCYILTYCVEAHCAALRIWIDYVTFVGSLYCGFQPVNNFNTDDVRFCIFM